MRGSSPTLWSSRARPRWFALRTWAGSSSPPSTTRPIPIAISTLRLRSPFTNCRGRTRWRRPRRSSRQWMSSRRNFLQTWRAAIIPIVAIPVSLIGTFFFMAVFGFSLNNLSLFGLVLAVGIVVDDAIVVVENVERNIAAGLAPPDAAKRTMEEVGSALIAIALVLCAVFVPAAFITGLTGQFYRQFALTITGATVISLIVSLTLSPAMCALLLKPHTNH